MQIWLQTVCSQLILHPLSVNNTSPTCFTFAFIENKIFAVYAVSAPSLLHSMPLHPDGLLSWWEGTHPAPTNGRVSGTTSTRRVSGLSRRQSYLPIHGSASSRKYVLCSNSMSGWCSFPRVTLWPGALMRVRSEKDTIIVFIPPVLNSRVFSLFQAQDTS